MTTFFGRRAELARLRTAWDVASGGRPQLVVLHGRRQVGKTALVRELLGMLPHSAIGLYCAATLETSESAQLARLADAAASLPTAVELPTESWARALARIAELAEQAPTALVLDEVPYLESSSPGFGSIVQAFSDGLRTRRTAAKLMIILTGSALATMRQLLGSGGPLFQRADIEMSLAPFDLPTSHAFLRSNNPNATIEAYAATGGYPGHLDRWDVDASADDNLARLAFDAYGVLLQNGYRLLVDAPTAGGHRRALDAIGRGLTRHSEIRNEIDQRAEPALEALERSGFIRRSVPVGDNPWSKRARYEIADPYLRFWFRCLYADLQLIEAGQGRAVQIRRRPAWREHVAWTFEEEARRHAIRAVATGQLPDDLVIGRWWTLAGRQVEIDVLGLRGNHTALIGEVKWSERRVDGRDLRALRNSLADAPDPESTPLFAFWSRSGATADVETAARVFGPTDMTAT